MSPLVSILIPCYNSDKWISDTINSALAQTWSNIEIIVIDDGSTDGSLGILKQFESPKVKVISQKNQGASAARNKAFSICKGDFVQYLDADDLLAPDKIELQMNLLLQDCCDYIIAGEWGFFFTNPLRTVFTDQALWRDMQPVNWLVCAWKSGGMMPPHSWLVPRNIIERAGNWNENLSLNDDGEYFCRVILSSNGVKFCPGAKSYYRTGIQNSLSRRRSRQSFLSQFNSIQIMTEQLLMVEDSPRTCNASACCWQKFIFLAYPQAKDLIPLAEEKIRILGGCDLKPGGGIMFQTICDILGWKTAIRLQRLYFQYRYQNRAG
ncbi:glycosyltransferase [Dolichospermum sp. LEGE 00246]|uniref:glycosyltransferase family 2 protein n=1 Tax=Dolichospermum sp. LEGE 00246 TaxID=1828605 RepID=UPI0018821E08|nr:glycosyltransferase [Dolichospermum sp. LEGE 00246]MBE9257381.1 glycosyltransferase [Dolichospermum sp. LEGE 00246]